MAYKSFLIDNSIKATVYKRRAARNLKLSITSTGQVRVSIPTWTSYAVATKFVANRLDWIKANLPSQSLMSSGQIIGKSHRLKLIAGSAEQISSRVSDNEVIVRYPDSFSTYSDQVQAAAGKAAIRALKLQAQTLLPDRLSNLAAVHGFTYSDMSVKHLKSRWGSCDQNRHIVLNLYLMQLPWYLIDYVLMHELVHTKVLKHGPEFWAEMSVHLDNPKELRAELNKYKPAIN